MMMPITSALMAVGTVVSRATGLIRQVLQAAALGTGLLATTYNQANTVPTSLYFLLIGGALNSVLVPQLVRARAEDADGGAACEQRLVTLVLCVLGAGPRWPRGRRLRSSASTSAIHPPRTTRSS
ncbi:lipid II flippase MurJ [Streptomyces sp. NPDC023838]|uniref:lipid II flippase MurJ n=1 Tax=Streptomyces sp. NPDC023838 TaxID=3154325 RepID=UPI0033F2B1C4